jgi:hypothetical protein
MRSLRQAAQIPSQLETQLTKDTVQGEKMTFIQNLKTMLADSDDISALSSKRVIALLAFICCMIGFFVDLFTSYQITQTIFDSMMWIVISGLGFTGLEKFAGRFQVTSKNEPPVS